jgi:ketosteroid isomerase-like protein
VPQNIALSLHVISLMSTSIHKLKLRIMTNLERLQDLYDKMQKGQMMEAFDQYYADNVQVVEATGEVRNGKEEQRAAIKQWGEMIKERHGGGAGVPTSNEAEGVTSIESWFDATFQDGKRNKMEEVAVQKWKDRTRTILL